MNHDIANNTNHKDTSVEFFSFLLDATQKASGALLALPDDAVFRSAKARPPQLPSCAVKCIVGVNDGFLYLVKAR